MSARSRPFTVLATYGTDHHAFDRLSRWLEGWLESRPATRAGARCVVQEGYSRPPAGARPIGIVPRPDLIGLMRDADVVLGQGGPGTVLDAAVAGRIPIVVPRLTRFDEVVDDHQVAFCRRMADDGRALLAESADRLHALLDGALADPASVRAEAGVPPIDDTVTEVRRLLGETAARPVGFVSLRRLREVTATGRSDADADVGPGSGTRSRTRRRRSA